ncbi:MAG: cytochrome b/b6 domain-containing protein [Acidobacteriota bacterium]|nr:cytochrome b/b6 domain-containing protein [Acidobacteriota bacterium]
MSCLFVALMLLSSKSLPLLAAEDCLSCHAPETGMVNSQGKAITVNPNSLAHSVHKDLGCVDCHAGAAKSGHTAKTASASCIACHADEGEKLSASAHAMLGDPKDSSTCIACHGTHDVVDPATRGVQFCATCHAKEVSQYNSSIHGRAHAKFNGDAPTCQSCHGTAHEVVEASNAKSPVSKANLPDTCGKCHSNPALAVKYMFNVALPVEAYKQSVHGRAIQAGNLKAASCNDCHGVHDILSASNPHSKIWKQNVAATCAQCHKNVFDVYRESIHGKAVAAGVLDAATCTDCHGEHRILAPGNPESTVSLANVSQVTCSRCHANTQLMARFNVPASRVPTYEDSYHGLASNSGQQTVANCASCHGVHNIFASSDPRSTVNKANLGKTCGKCHPDAGQRFTIGTVHTLPTSTAGGRALSFVKAFYLLAIPFILGFMVLHNLLDWWRKARRILEQYRVGHGQVRLTLNERTQHVLLLVSFITLVVTGFALKYPHSFWAEPIVQWEKNFPLRGWLHRIAGVVLIGGSVYHVIYLLIQRDGRRWMKAMLPRARDVQEAVQTVGYNIGYRPTLPRYARFNYMEKAEYWALVWGTIVMAATGILLWAHDWVLAYLPYPMSVLDVTTAVHFYEAILATFSILIWHFYFVIFDPEVYPLKWTVLTGRAPEHEVREEEEEEIVPPPPEAAAPPVGSAGQTPSSPNPGAAGEPTAKSEPPSPEPTTGDSAGGAALPGDNPFRPN